MTFTQLRTFALVAELGSLRAAAAALGVSEPAVSAALAALRPTSATRCSARTGSGIALTPGGRALAARARELVRLADRTRREVGQAHQFPRAGPPGPVRPASRLSRPRRARTTGRRGPPQRRQGRRDGRLAE